MSHTHQFLDMECNNVPSYGSIVVDEFLKPGSRIIKTIITSRFRVGHLVNPQPLLTVCGISDNLSFNIVTHKAYNPILAWWETSNGDDMIFLLPPGNLTLEPPQAAPLRLNRHWWISTPVRFAPPPKNMPLEPRKLVRNGLPGIFLKKKLGLHWCEVFEARGQVIADLLDLIHQPKLGWQRPFV